MKTKQTILFVWLFYTMSTMMAQVGIGTVDPQNDLHIAGSSSGVRIEGLSAVNNSNNTGVRPASVYVDGNGDLYLPATPANADLIFNVPDAIDPAITIDSGVTGGPGSAVLVSSADFVLSQDAIIMINYNALFSISTQSDGVIDDGKAKLIRTSLRILDQNAGGSIYETGGFSSISYSNTVETGGVGIGGSFSCSGAMNTLLPAGTYKIEIVGVIAANTGGSTNTDDAFRVVFGATSFDEFKLIALY